MKIVIGRTVGAPRMSDIPRKTRMRQLTHMLNCSKER